MVLTRPGYYVDQWLSQFATDARFDQCHSPKLFILITYIEIGNSNKNIKDRASLTNLIILMSIQLLVDVVMSLKKIGANDK